MKIFESTAREVSQYNGLEVVGLQPMPEAYYDRAEVGPMFDATLANGVTVGAFADEIREVEK